MAASTHLAKALKYQGVSRRGFLKFCTIMTSILALPPSSASKIAENLAQAKRLSVIWLSFQECTACTESMMRSDTTTIENLIFDFISLDYHHTLQAASGYAAEAARKQAMHDNKGEYIVIVDGSIPLKDEGIYSTIAGVSNVQMFEETVKNAKAIIAVGTCASFGGLAHANPNPTGAVSVEEVLKEKGIDKPLINISGCPPVPIVITSVIVEILTLGRLPELDALHRPKIFFGKTIHRSCYRRSYYKRHLFAKSFDDEGARKGYCLYKLGCKGPRTYNTCATARWNGGISFPIQAGHGCFGCSEPNFWDAGGIYN